MAVWNQWTGKKPFSLYNNFLESGYSLSHFTNMLTSKSWWLKVTCIASLKSWILTSSYVVLY